MKISGTGKVRPEDVIFSVRNDGRLWLNIRGDGSVEYGPEYDPDIATREIFSALGQHLSRALMSIDNLEEKFINLGKRVTDLEERIA